MKRIYLIVPLILIFLATFAGLFDKFTRFTSIAVDNDMTIGDSLVVTTSILTAEDSVSNDSKIGGVFTVDGQPILKTMSFFDPSPDADATMAVFNLENDITVLQYDVSAETAPTSEAGITFYFRQGGVNLGEDSLAGTASSAERFKSHTGNFDLAAGLCSLFIDDIEDANAGTANVNWLFQFTEKDD